MEPVIMTHSNFLISRYSMITSNFVHYSGENGHCEVGLI